MKVLVLAEKYEFSKPFVSALKAKGVKAQRLKLVELSLVSKHKNTLIKSSTEDVPKYDAALLLARSSLAPFTEPLIHEFNNQNIYCNAYEGAYYICNNQAYKFVNLSAEGIKTPRTIISGSGKNIEKAASKVSYPLIVKSFYGNEVQQSVCVKNSSELKVFVRSIKSKMDAFMLREYIDGKVISCVVIGHKVFAIERSAKDYDVQPMSKGKFYQATDEEKEIAITAANASGFEIARIDLVKNHVLSVKPTFPLKIFNAVCSDNLENHVASFLIDKVNEQGVKKTASDELKELGGKISKSVFSRFIK